LIDLAYYAGDFMSDFVVKGTFKAGHIWEKFTKNVESQNEKNAVEKVYSLFGSKNGIKRYLIKIDSVEEA
jgi:large subunit ribosomal protein LX